MALAFVPRGAAGVALALVGVALIARGMTGQSLVQATKRISRTFGSWRDRERHDAVDRALLESFPASDPPARSPTKA